LIVYGWKQYVKVLAVLHLVCVQCGNKSEHVLRLFTTKATLFWIPLFPISKKRTLFCTACECEQKVPKEQALALASGQGGPQPFGPQPMPGQLPGQPAFGPPSGPNPAFGPPPGPQPAYGPPSGPNPAFGPPSGPQPAPVPQRAPVPPPGYGPPPGPPPGFQGPPPGYPPPGQPYPPQPYPPQGYPPPGYPQR
jgi:hypothetical protein